MLYHSISFLFLLQTNTCKPVSSHLLPAGWSLEKQKYITKPKKRPLFPMKVGVVCDTVCFLKFWEMVLGGAGARVFSITSETSMLFIFYSSWIVIKIVCSVCQGCVPRYSDIF
jgi:hypothetical protein